MMLSTFVILASPTPFYWATPRSSYYEPSLWHESWIERALDQVQPAASYSRWTISSDAYELKVRMPDSEPASVRAALSQDGTKIEVIGERKIEGCTCTPSTLKEIELPYRPRAEDIDVAMEKDGVLTLRLERHAKADAPTQLTVKQAANKKEPEVTATATATKQDAAVAETASTAKLAEQEKTLTDKFRAAARVVSVAAGGTHSGSEEQPAAPATSVKEAAAAMAEGKSADAIADATPSSAANDALP